jgi:uncharacterized protein YfiM (DUF2279 family)
MANTNSAQITALASSSGKAAANELAGRLRVAYFSVAAVPTGAGDTMTLTKLPKGAKPLRGVLQFTVAQGATATTAIGIAGATGKYRAAAVTNATTEFVFITTAAENMGVNTTVEETILATNAAAAWTAAAFSGYIIYVVD